jgi:hypothetical protein
MKRTAAIFLVIVALLTVFGKQIVNAEDNPKDVNLSAWTEQEYNDYVEFLKTHGQYFYGGGIQFGYAGTFYQPSSATITWKNDFTNRSYSNTTVSVKNVVKSQLINGIGADVPLYLGHFYGSIGGEFYIAETAMKKQYGNIGGYPFTISDFTRFDVQASAGYVHPIENMEVHVAATIAYEYVAMTRKWSDTTPPGANSSQLETGYAVGAGPRVGFSYMVAPHVFLGIEGFGYFGGFSAYGGQASIGFLITKAFSVPSK